MVIFPSSTMSIDAPGGDVPKPVKGAVKKRMSPLSPRWPERRPASLPWRGWSRATP